MNYCKLQVGGCICNVDIEWQKHRVDEDKEKVYEVKVLPYLPDTSQKRVISIYDAPS